MMKAVGPMLVAVTLVLGCGGDGGGGGKTAERLPSTLAQVMANPQPAIDPSCAPFEVEQQVPVELASRGVAAVATSDCNGDLEAAAVIQMKDEATAESLLTFIVRQEERKIDRERTEVSGLPQPSYCASLREESDDPYESCAAKLGRFVVFALGDESIAPPRITRAAGSLADWVRNAG